LKRAGEYLDLVAIHMMGQSPKRPDTALKGLRYEKEPEQAWEELLDLSNTVEQRVSELERAIVAADSGAGIAITEGHLSLSPHNTNPILYEWLSAVYHARSLNIYQRHGARVKIATAADFQGNRWTNTAVMLPTPRGAGYLMPVGSIARLFKRHNGKQAVAVKSAPSGLDIAASRTAGKFYLHVANLEYRKSVVANIAVADAKVTGGRVFAIEPEDLRTYVDEDQPEVFKPKEIARPANPAQLRFAPGSVCAIELDVEGV